MASFLTALGNIGNVLQHARDDAAKSQQQAQLSMQRLQELQAQQKKLADAAKQEQAAGMAYGGLQGLEGLSGAGQQGAAQPQNPMGPGQPSVPMQQPGPQAMPPQGAPQSPPGAGAPQGAPPQGMPQQPMGGGMPQGGMQGQPQQQQTMAPALTGPGGMQLPASFDVRQAMSYLEKQNPGADPATLFSALGQMGGMWEQLHPQAKQDYQLLRENIKAQVQMDMLQQRMKATDEQIDRRSELAKIRDQILEAGRDRRAGMMEEGRNERSATHEGGVESRFEKRQDAQAGKASAAAAVRDIADQKTEIKDQITKLNRERAAIKGKYAFGQPPTNSEDFRALQQKAAEIDKLSDQTIQLDRQLRQARSGGAKPAAAPKEVAAEQPSSGPQKGDVEGGYRFKGGDPGDPSAWEKVND